MKNPYTGFIQRKKPRPKSDLRLFIEGSLMVFFGINLIIFLNSIPEKLVWEDFLLDTWTDLSQGFIQLLEALLKIGAATSVLFLLIFSIFLLIGGLYRFLRLISRVNLQRSKKLLSNRK
tara:strand:- start:172 stop:528 length:357 start_codon:yes stop_codon:yes gene_type:complete